MPSHSRHCSTGNEIKFSSMFFIVFHSSILKVVVSPYWCFWNFWIYNASFKQSLAETAEGRCMGPRTSEILCEDGAFTCLMASVPFKAVSSLHYWNMCPRWSTVFVKTLHFEPVMVIPPFCSSVEIYIISEVWFSNFLGNFKTWSR